MNDLQLLTTSGVSQIIPGFTTFRNKDNILCIVLNHIAQKYWDMDAHNAERKLNNMPFAYTKEEMMLQLAEDVGGVTSSRWLREMENQFGAANKALAAYHQFDYAFHTGNYPGRIPGVDVHVSIDFGTDHVCVTVAQIETFTGYQRIHLHDVLRGHNENLETFLQETVMTHLANKYPTSDIVWYMVQEGKNRNGAGIQDKNGAKSPKEVMNNLGIIPKFQYHHIKDGVEAVNRQLERSILKGMPVVTVNPAELGFVDCFNGGYRKEWIEKYKRATKTENFIKDGTHDHVSDSIRVIFYIKFPIRKKKETHVNINRSRTPRIPGFGRRIK